MEEASFLIMLLFVGALVLCLAFKVGKIGVLSSICGIAGGFLLSGGMYIGIVVEDNSAKGWLLIAIAVIGLIVALIKKFQPPKETYIKIVIGLVIVAIIAIPIVWGFLDDDGDKWNSLSDEEKEWYHDNFGDGQYDEIQDAISVYRGY